MIGSPRLITAGVARLASTDIGAWSALLEVAGRISSAQKIEREAVERRCSVIVRLIFIRVVVQLFSLLTQEWLFLPLGAAVRPLVTIN